MIKGIILGFQVFTRLPFHMDIEFNNKNMKWGLYSIPLIGLVIGAIVGGVMYLFRDKPELLRGGVGLLTYYFVTGGLHLDGLSDTADGFLANKDRETTLAIMSDSLIGVFGTLALLIYAILKVGGYTGVSKDNILDLAILSMITRTGVLYIISRGRLAKSEGFGKFMKDSIGKGAYLVVALVFVGLVIYGDMRFIKTFVGMIILNEVLIYLSYKKIDGVTGDIYGASIEIGEIIGLLIMT